MKFFINAILALSLLLSGYNAQANNITYVLAARKGDLFNTQNRISDMVANVNTTAFKKEQNVYSELNKRLDDGDKLSFSNISTTKRDYSQGPLQVTGRQLDIAINGKGYFMVETPWGMRFTRAGNLQANTNGALITKEGYPLVGPGGGQVELAEGDFDITIRENGLVTVGVEERGQIGVFVFADESKLIKEGKGLYKTSQNPEVSEESKIVQGMLEGSNVNSVTAMTQLIEVSRRIDSIKKMENDYHGLQLNAIRSLAKQ